MILTKRDFLIGLLGTSVIAVLPKAATIADAAPVLDPFAVEAPKDITYQWVRCSLMGEPDPRNVQLRLDNGWTFVPPERHPEAPNHDIEVAVKGSGLILMQKPTALIEQLRARELPFQVEGKVWRPMEAPEGFTFVGSSRDKA